MRKLIFFLLAFCCPRASAQTISFGEAYEQMLGRSLRIETQKIELEASEERRLRGWGAFGPTVAIEANDARANDPFVSSTISSRSAALTGSINLWRSGGDVAGLNAAKKSVETQTERLSSETYKFEDEAIAALITFIGNVQARQISDKILQLRADSLRIAQERFQRGLLPMQEVDKVAIDLENARASFVDTQTRESEARAKLQTYLGHDRVSIEWPWRQTITTTAPLETREFRADARPDWRALNSSIAEESLKKRQTLGSLLPTLDFSASYGSLDLSNSDRRDWKTVLTLSVPLFDRLRDYANFRLQSLAVRGAETRLEALKREAPAEVESLRKSHRASRESALSREKTAKITERLYADNLQRFRLGRASVNDLAIDQDRLLQSQLLEIEGWGAMHLTYARLCHALGSRVAASGACESK